MNEYTVTFRLDPGQEEEIKKIADGIGRTIGDVFEMMMLTGSSFLIDARIKHFQSLFENTSRNHAQEDAQEDIQKDDLI